MDWPSQLRAALPSNVARLIAERHLAKGQFLFLRGDMPQAMYCVTSGEIRLVRTLSTGKDVVLHRARQGFVAEASLDQDAYHCDAIAACSSSVLTIPRHAFRQGLEEPGFRGFWSGYVMAELRRARSQNERLGLRTGRERILHYIETEGRTGHLMLTQSKKSWSLELGISHEALYRTLQKMTADGEIAITGNTLRICG
jgi:CRP-like cAMP-binding protein